MDTYTLPRLRYSYDALEPYIDVQTMEVHHKGHHKTYVEKLNSALQDHEDLRRPVEELLASIDTLPIDIREDVKNNAGGHANHSLFWTLLTPEERQSPSGSFLQVIDSVFGSFTYFRQEFTELALEHFSNGWAWLCADTEDKLVLSTTKDHESPLSDGITPLLVLDLWEHAYYLKHQNRRAEYVDAFWNIVNWKEIAARWDEFQKTGASNREWRLTA